MSTPSFKSFEAMILYFNGMYKLPISPVPSLHAEAGWQARRKGLAIIETRKAIQQRFDDFFKSILAKEVKEHEDIDLENAEEIDILVELADLLGDIQVYCASEMIRYGLPNSEVLRIIMDSNFSKLDAEGNPIYDADGKVCKGPNYWKPEPQIKQLLLQLIEDHNFAEKHEGE